MQVPVDSTGKKLQTFNNTVGSDSVHSEGVTLVRSSDNTEVGVSGQPVRIDPTGTTTQPISDAGGSLTVDGTVASSNLPTTVDTNSGVKSASTLRVILATDQPALTNKLLVTPDSVALPANQSVNLNQAAGTALDVNSGTKSAGTIRVVLATDQPALTNALKVDGSAVTQPVSFGPVTSGGTSAYHAVAAASNNAAAVKGSAGQVYGWSIYNNAAYPVYVKLYNKATAPAPASDNALIIKVIGIQSGTYASYFSVCGIAGFSSGIGIAAVKGITDTDNTSLLLSDCLIEIDYK